MASLRTDSASAALLRSRMPSGVAWMSSRNFFVSRPSELSCRQAVAPARGDTLLRAHFGALAEPAVPSDALLAAAELVKKVARHALQE